MGVAAEIGQHLLGAAERRLGIDDPVDAPQLVEPVGEGRGLGEAGEVAEEAQLAGVEGGLQVLEEQPAEQAREHAHRQEEAGPAGDPARAVEREAAARHDAMDVRMMVQVLAPGVEHGDDADLGAEMLGIGGDGAQRLGGGAEQDGVDRRLVLEGDLGHRRRQGEDDVEVRHRQQLGLRCGQPFGARQPLALRAMPVAAGVVGDADQRRSRSQCSTWPPSAAVRHSSMALMTRRSTRPRWPAWAWR